MRHIGNLIIGGGPAGLAVAYALQGDTLVIEKNGDVGGLCRSIEYDGGVFDIGGHSFHTPHPEVHDLVSEVVEGGLYTQTRDARVHAEDTLIPYPFQKHFDQLPNPDVVAECQRGLEQAESRDAAAADNFEEFILAKFGEGIAEHFMLPYNRKLWARDIRKISCEWTSERVAGAKGEKETFSRQGAKRKPLQDDTRVGYPAEGGYQEIFRGLVPHVPEVSVNSDIVAVDPVAKTAHTADGRVYRWQKIVSSMPLPQLVRVVAGVPRAIVDCADRLEYMSLRVELLLAGRRLDTEIQRIYCSDPAIPAHKIALNHNSSESLRNRPRHAIMAEVSLSEEKNVDVDTIAPQTIEFLCDLGIVASSEDIIWQSHVDVHYAYPVYTHERPELVAAVKEWMGQHDIHTVGRFGDWEYVNSDKCVHKGLALGKTLRAQSATTEPQQTDVAE